MFYKFFLNYQLNDSSISSACQIFTLKLASLTNLSTGIGTIATILLFSQSVLAQSFSGYCISPENKTNLSVKKQIPLYLETPDSITVNGQRDREYKISIDKINQKKLLITPAGDKDSIDQMTLAGEGGQIVNLALDQDNWLWIDRLAVDYVMKINLSPETAYFESPMKLPELSTEPCYLLKRLFKKCRHAQSSYSYALNRVFITGYPIKSWRKKDPIHWEFVSGEKKSVPEALKEATFVADIPEWKGALFQHPSGKALFYDGTEAVDLSQDFLQLQNGDKFQNWEIRKTRGGRSFLGKFNRRTNKDPLFLMELNPQPGLTPVYLPEDLNQKWLEVFTFDNDAQNILWIITRKAIFTQTNRKLKTVVSLPVQFFIKKVKLDDLNLAEENNDYISFTVKKDKTKLSSNYMLQEVDAEANCDTPIDLNGQTILKLIN